MKKYNKLDITIIYISGVCLGAQIMFILIYLFNNNIR